jgi:hypothetical protein
VSDGDSVRVTKDGIVFAHAGDVISAEPEAEAEGEAVEEPGKVVHYHFPVHIEVHVHGHDAIESAIERRLNALASLFESL